ncbi:MAG: diacylglycerol kinase family protein [Bacteroidota bacterium]
MTEEKKKIVFIVNPKAGITPKSKVVIELLAGNLIPSSRFIPEVVFTERAGHATEIARDALNLGADIVVASGGDGTVNEVARAMVNTGVPMGILPAGSGNGLARCLGISINYALALRTIIRGNTKLMDVATVNDMLFTSIAGIGFDAHVAQKFSETYIRGMIAYMQITLKEFSSYKPQTYHLTVDGIPMEKHALMIVFANSDQFGFNTRIAPDAKVDDGFLDICVIKKMPASQLINFGYHMMTGTPAKSGYAEYFRGKEITVSTAANPLMNIDGEPKIMESPVKISIKPLALRVIVP